VVGIVPGVVRNIAGQKTRAKIAAPKLKLRVRWNYREIQAECYPEFVSGKRVRRGRRSHDKTDGLRGNLEHANR
jgi:hypothetical protein